MIKHRGFPSRMTGTDFQFTIRRENTRKVSPLVFRERFSDRRDLHRAADRAFLGLLIKHFNDKPFARGNLDAGRLSWLFGKEVLPVSDDFDPCCYEELLVIDLKTAKSNFPELF